MKNDIVAVVVILCLCLTGLLMEWRGNISVRAWTNLGKASAESLPSGGSESTTLREISWLELDSEGRLLSGTIVPSPTETREGVLHVSNPVSEATTVHIFTLEHPGITQKHFAVVGEVRYEGVEGQGYLETWFHFPTQGKYFSRTLGTDGPFRSLKGSSGWREFSLPFSVTEGNEFPDAFDFNVFLPGKGEVFIKSVHLVEYSDRRFPPGTGPEWWNRKSAGLVGAVIGILGGLFGVVCGLSGALAYTGKGKRLVMGLLGTFAVVSAGEALLGVAAWYRSQPYHVYYPLILSGAIGLVVALSLVPVFRRAYHQAEFRRMHSIDG